MGGGRGGGAVRVASNLSFSGRTHVGWLFTNEEQEKGWLFSNEEQEKPGSLPVKSRKSLSLYQ